jgi:hypothetical protein
MGKIENLKKDKPNNGKVPMNWNQVIITVLVCLAAVIVGFIVTMGSVTKELASSPEVPLALSGNVDENLLLLSILKNFDASADIDLGADVDMEFNGHWPEKYERQLEKVNLSCVDQYTYLSHQSPESYNADSSGYVNALEFFESANDQGCMIYGSAGNVTLFKCPKRNCRMREISVETSAEDFIPTDISITKVSAEAGGKYAIGD